MFTGLVAVLGALAARSPRGPGARLVFDAQFSDGALALGESIAVDGACLTVDAIGASGFEADASAETLAKTTLGRLEAGAPVHLERALRAGDRIGGHLVSGHVDGVATVIDRRSFGESLWMALRAPPDLSRFIAEKGSITVDGVSLTINRVLADRFEVMLVPHTLAKTKLGALAPGSPVNLEVDVLARYVARLIAPER